MKKNRMLALLSLGMLSVFSCNDSEEIINLEPSVPRIIIPVDEAKDVAKDIVLKWNKSIDPEKADVKYDVYLGTKKELTTEDIKSKAQVGTDYTATLSGHATYFWKLVATDSDGVSSETAVFTFVTENSIPNKSLAEFPVDKAENVAKSISLKWSTSDDSDADLITYSLYLAKKNVFTDKDIVGEALESNEFKLEKLDENVQYFWKVITKDSQGASVESDVFSFTTLNLAPNAVVGSFPEHEATGVEKTITFNWSESLDENGVKYYLYLAKKNVFAEEDIVGKDLEATEFEVNDLDPNTQYFWKVSTKDPAGLSVESNVYSFTTINGLPSTVKAISPSNNATIDSESVICQWTASVDVDKDVLKYDFYLSEKNSFTDADIKGSNLQKTQFEQSSLKNKTQYFWKVVTKDSEGASVDSEVFSFTTDYKLSIIVAITEPVQIIYKENLYVNVAWTSNADALKYDVFVSVDSEFTESDLKQANVEALILQVPGLDFESDYKVKVVAKNAEGESVSSEIYDLRTIAFKSEISGRPACLKPAANFDDIPTEFEWSAVGKGVKYDLIISAHSNFSDPILEKKDLLETSLTVDLSAVAFGDVQYFWKVIAKGEQGDVKEKASFSSRFMKSLPLTFKMGTFTDARDSHEYKTVTFKGKTWLAENFAYLPFFVDEDADENKCSVYGLPIVKPMFGGADWTMPTIEEAKAHENFAKYGVMYTAYFLDDIAPEGWHVATDEEWKELEKHTGMTEREVDGTSYRGNTVHKLLSTTSTWANNPVPTNEFKLDIKPGGYNTGMEDKGEDAYIYFWTNSYTINFITGLKKYFNRALKGVESGVNRGNTRATSSKMYVRLVKD